MNKEIRRLTDSVGIVATREANVRLVGAVPAEQPDEWAEGRRYLGLDGLACCRLTIVRQYKRGSDFQLPAALTA